MIGPNEWFFGRKGSQLFGFQRVECPLWSIGFPHGAAFSKNSNRGKDSQRGGSEGPEKAKMGRAAEKDACLDLHSFLGISFVIFYSSSLFCWPWFFLYITQKNLTEPTRKNHSPRRSKTEPFPGSCCPTWSFMALIWRISMPWGKRRPREGRHVLALWCLPRWNDPCTRPWRTPVWHVLISGGVFGPLFKRQKKRVVDIDTYSWGWRHRPAAPFGLKSGSARTSLHLPATSTTPCWGCVDLGAMMDPSWAMLDP